MISMEELQEQRLFDNNIDLEFFPLEQSEAFCGVINDNKYICLSSKKERSKINDFWIIEHELAHLESSALYNVNSNAKFIKKMERKANDRMILNFNLPIKVLNLLKLKKQKWEVIEQLEINSAVYDSCIDYLKRKGSII